ncbi:MAG: gamma-glutamyltransferase family protein [Thermodesulfobacteriota bacterium]
MSRQWTFPYPSQRMPVCADNVLATSQPLAAQAGLGMLARGGNAVDAALAAAIALTVVEPTSNGLGSDLFALVWDGNSLQGINGSGRSPRALDIHRFRGMHTMPVHGWDAVTVPGAVQAWRDLSQRFGRMPFCDLFEPAIRYARDGFVVSPLIARQWAAVSEPHASRPEFAATFLPGGRSPQAGERFFNPDQARSLSLLAKTHGQALYQGELAEALVRQATEQGGALQLQDLAGHASSWVDPISWPMQNWEVQEMPPNGQGLAALMALGILDILEVGRCPVDSGQAIHYQVEAMKAAFAEIHGHVGDPQAMTHPVKRFLDPTLLEELAGSIRPDKAARPVSRLPANGGTVYLAAADAQGRMVSLIQSNYQGFGSGVVIQGTGISLQNRGAGFVLDPKHPNCVAGGKRPFHTIIPGFVTSQGKPVLSFGVMGAHMQPQGHVQVLQRMKLWGQNAQSALDAPRWQVNPDCSLALEPGLAAGIGPELAALGHELVSDPSPRLFGGGQIVHCLDSGYAAASDPRKDGQAVGF